MTTETEYIEIEASGRDYPVSVVPAAPVALFGTTEPMEIVEKAEAIANVLMTKVRSHTDLKGKRDLVADIQGKEHICVGGWTLLGSLVGVFPVCQWTKETETGWEARVEAHTLAGQVVGAAEASCDRTEKMWGSRDSYALRSMAQTRATSKALRMPLGFIASLAGFDGTPAEEMDFLRDEYRRPDAAGARIPPRDDRPKPSCPDHASKSIKFVKAGISGAGKEYGAFWKCEAKDCTLGRNKKGWSIFDDAWQNQLNAARGGSSGLTQDDLDVPFNE